MVRVAGLKGQQLQGVDEMSVDGMSVAQQLAAISADADRLTDTQDAIWNTIAQELAAAGIRVLGADDVPFDSAESLAIYFRDQVFPVLTPQALDPAHPFPFIPNQGLGLIFDLQRRSDGVEVRELVMIPATLPRFIRLSGDAADYIAVEDAIRRFSVVLFPGYDVRGSGAFRIIRDSDLEIEEEAEDLVRYFRTAIMRRRRGRVIRLELETGIPPELEAKLKRELGGTGWFDFRSHRISGRRCARRAGRRRPARPEVRALFAALPRAYPRI